MPVKIRLQRHGKKGKPFYWIVAADARSKRDGKYLEKLGSYNPNNNPAEIILDIDSTVNWLQNGAQPTDTARNILSYKGVMLKNHLAGGVRKGALTEEQAEKKFNAWLTEKEASIDGKRAKLSDAESKVIAEALAAEKAVNDKRIADAVVEEVVEEVEETTEEAVEVATEETLEVATEEAPAEVEATTEEAPAEEEATKEEK
ncbi:MAG: small subunit ribosomal protein S16 [Flavobacteriaceae bacterium]|jgi:small subunit ribosomal protein S16|uniref:30S ribosomal protein S16 n=1 Tax=Candidatus Marifrigoribacter sp. Uisw_064 TaxID=3230970 RepID=UPI003AECECC2